MPDGKRKRRRSTLASKRKWYALYRAVRFGRRFGLETTEAVDLRRTWVLRQIQSG